MPRGTAVELEPSASRVSVGVLSAVVLLWEIECVCCDPGSGLHGTSWLHPGLRFLLSFGEDRKCGFPSHKLF